MSKMLNAIGSAGVEDGSSIEDRGAAPPGSLGALLPHFSRWPRYMLRTLVQRQAPVHRKPKQVLSGFSIDKPERCVLGSSYSTTATYYTKLPLAGNPPKLGKMCRNGLRSQDNGVRAGPDSEVTRKSVASESRRAQTTRHHSQRPCSFQPERPPPLRQSAASLQR